MAKKRKKRRFAVIAAVIIALAAAAAAGYIYRDRLPFGEEISSAAETVRERIERLSTPAAVIKCYQRAINEKSSEYMIRIYPKAVRDAYNESETLRERLDSAMDLGISGTNELSVKITERRSLTDAELTGLREFAKTLAQDEHISELGINADELADFSEGCVLVCDYGDGESQEITLVHEPEGWCISPKTAFGMD